MHMARLIQFAADAYDAVYILKAAMEEANVTDMAVGDIWVGCYGRCYDKKSKLTSDRFQHMS